MAPPEITAMDRLAAASPPPPRPAGLIAAWIMTGIVLALTATIVIGWRDTIVRVWPPSTRILGVTAHTGPHEARTEAKKAE